MLHDPPERSRWVGYFRVIAMVYVASERCGRSWARSGGGNQKRCIIGRVDDVAAFILAGGKSTRMGQDKAFLKLQGRTLVERALAVAQEVAKEVRIVGDPQKFSRFGSVIEDVYRERGPLGGIHAALTSTERESNLILAVDLPLVEAAFLRWLVDEASQSGAVVTVARVGGRWQPLCAVYRKSFASASQRALEAGKNKIDPLFAEVKTRIIAEDEMLQRGYSLEIFRNLNTPEEYRVASTGYREKTNND
jgi:molybdenum cofactor guanylyltransferase